MKIDEIDQFGFFMFGVFFLSFAGGAFAHAAWQSETLTAGVGLLIAGTILLLQVVERKGTRPRL